MASLVGIDFSAKILASLAKLFEDEYSKEDGLSLRNLTLLLCYLCIFDVISRLAFEWNITLPFFGTDKS
jgi:nucleolar MIF4G domain-containing protein 1